MADTKRYTPHDFSKVRGLTGISDKQIEEHLKLYEGYVKRTNALTEKLAALCNDGQGVRRGPGLRRAHPAARVRVRRHGEPRVLLRQPRARRAGGAARRRRSSARRSRRSFGKYETWLADFRAIATMPGIGWAMTFQDPATGWLSNHWITLHENNVPPGFRVVLALDGWEHAFMRDYLATERAKYVDAFFKNVDWEAVEKRIA